MRICLSVEPGETLQLSPHFGESGHFVIFDTDTQQFVSHERDAMPCRGPCRCAIPANPQASFDAVVCRSIGHRILQALRLQGLAVLQSEKLDAREAVQAALDKLLPAVPRSTCLTGRRSTRKMPVRRDA